MPNSIIVLANDIVGLRGMDFTLFIVYAVIAVNLARIPGFDVSALFGSTFLLRTNGGKMMNDCGGGMWIPVSPEEDNI